MRFVRWLAALWLLLPAVAQAQPAPLSVVIPPGTVGVTATSVTCGTSSTPFGVTGTTYLSVTIPPGAGNVWFAWNGSTATTAPPSQAFTGGTTITWGGGTGTCIVSTGTQAITVITR
jgi:hypothetical protein